MLKCSDQPVPMCLRCLSLWHVHTRLHARTHALCTGLRQRMNLKQWIASSVASSSPPSTPPSGPSPSSNRPNNRCIRLTSTRSRPRLMVLDESLPASGPVSPPPLIPPIGGIPLAHCLSVRAYLCMHTHARSRARAHTHTHRMPRSPGLADRGGWGLVLGDKSAPCSSLLAFHNRSYVSQVHTPLHIMGCTCAFCSHIITSPDYV